MKQGEIAYSKNRGYGVVGYIRLTVYLHESGLQGRSQKILIAGAGSINDSYIYRDSQAAALTLFLSMFLHKILQINKHL